MADCRKCSDFDWCLENEDCGLFKPKQMTNADRIRAMTDEELADWLCRHIRKCSECVAEDICEHTGVKANGLLKWLRQETKDG